MEYSTLSKELTVKLSKAVKKQDGIYFTPPAFVQRNIELLKPYLLNASHVLEPSCGSCEYITALCDALPTAHVTGVEYNDAIYESIVGMNSDQVRLVHADFLKYETDQRFDCIVGNTPYYVMKKADIDKFYYSYFVGRPNIFIPFIIKSSLMLKDNGVMSFVLPKNFLNCLYYDKTRKYIASNFQILHIVECRDKYIDTQQDTVLLIVQLKDHVDNKLFVLENEYTIFVLVESRATMTGLYKNSKSLTELGFNAVVGTVVWNQCKKVLTDDPTKTRLIYSSDIVNNSLVQKTYKNGEKKNYINKPGNRYPLLVINRGYGVGEYKFNYCLLDEPFDCLVENHLICIKHTVDMTKKDLIAAYKKIIASFDDPRTAEFIRLYFGNNAVNTTELNNILPIYQDI